MKLFIETLGCPKNFNDSEGIGGIWKKAGMSVTDSLEAADAILINTCGFINDAKKESIDKIFDMVRFAQEKAKTAQRPLLIVSGCLSERYGKELFDEIPEVDIFMGVNDYERLPELVANSAEGKRQQAFSCHPEKFEEFSTRNTEAGSYSMTLRIAEGCNNCCAYCVIPKIRGRYRSRPMENIVAEARELAESGCREIILIAQDVTEYGRDLYGELKLPKLLTELCKIEKLRWIRLMYCYEDKISDELIEVIASQEKICNYLDIPIQHCSDNVLGKMNRHSTNAGIRATLKRLREAVADIHIRTTLITGFPGETEEDFEQLADFVEEQRFERLGVFAYSQEEGTAAGDMPNQLDEDIKTARADSIMRRQLDISAEINELKIGRTMEVMVDEKDEDGSYIGRTRYDAPEIDNAVIFRSDRKLKPGDIVSVRITDAFDYDLVGRTED